VLSKKDLHETLVDYPDAQETLKKKARYSLIPIPLAWNRNKILLSMTLFFPSLTPQVSPPPGQEA